MKKALLVFVSLLFISSLTRAQVLLNFNGGSIAGAEKSNDSGPGLDSVYFAHDPLNSTNGVMAMRVHWDSASWHGRMDLGDGKGNSTYYVSGGAQYMTFWVYIDSAQNVPDSMTIDAYAMDNKGWNWTEPGVGDKKYFIKDIPHNVWYPISYSLAATGAAKPAFGTNAATTGAGFMTGLQFWPNTAASVGWNGIIYVDDISLVGALPTVIAGPGITGLEKSNDSGPGIDSLYAATDPNGTGSVCAMRVHWDSASWHGRMDLGDGKGNSTYFVSNGAQYVSFWVYIDSAQNVPDSMTIDSYAMDNKGWNWTEPGVGDKKYLMKDIPHNVWYPIKYSLAATGAAKPAFGTNIATAGAGFMTGLQFWPNTAASVGWHGIIYVKNIALTSTVTALNPSVWVAADFETAGKNGKQGFYVPSNASGTIKRYADLTTSDQSYVLQCGLNISKSARLFSVVRDSIPMRNPVNDSAAMSISMGLYLPTKAPTHAIVTFFVTGPKGTVVSLDTVGGRLKGGQWNTLTIGKLASSGAFDPTKPAQVGIDVTFQRPYDTTSYSGTIEIDNLAITGFAMSSELLDGIKNSSVAKVYKLYSNYPNPFNPTTMIQYDLAKDSKVRVQVYDVLGRLVATLVDNENQVAGTHQIEFNASKLASGVYFYRLNAGSYTSTQRMMLIK